MPKIQVLSDDLANRIAAGEVVERPASVVKELVENALDAGARRIAVAVEEGGRRFIRVTDNGEGMAPEDAAACLLRHATSKLGSDNDLFAIRTLGFRGEALPSIASVSRLTLETQAENAPGTAIAVAGGQTVSRREAAFPRGAEITVEDLFFNVPARRKFLRSESHELSLITTVVTHYALAFPEVHFTLKSGHFEVLAAPPAGSHRDRIFQVFGREFLDDLVETERRFGRSGMGARIFASRPHVQKMNRNSMFFFVNRRLIRDRIVHHAITEAYRNILPSGVFPVAILFLTVPFGDVDVNVHPAKTEVRFKHQGFVHDAIRDGILAALTEDRSVVAMDVAGAAASPFAAPPPPPRIPESWAGAATSIVREPFALDNVQRPVDGVQRPLGLGFVAAPQDAPDGLSPLPSSSSAPAPTRDFDRMQREIRPLGQLRSSYIIAADSTGVVLIDQHVAHERVLFEGYLKQMMSGALEVQRLLTPIVMQLPPRQLAILDNIAPELERNGFEVEPFGPKTVAVKSAPAILKAGAVEKLLAELLDALERETQAVDIAALQRKIAASVSCHAAIKINTPLDDAKMRWLVAEWSKTDVPTVCPHGRPIVLRYDLREIERGFKRA
jgi:DNA mismatch repair protein MutL